MDGHSCVVTSGQPSINPITITCDNSQCTLNFQAGRKSDSDVETAFNKYVDSLPGPVGGKSSYLSGCSKEVGDGSFAFCGTFTNGSKETAEACFMQFDAGHNQNVWMMASADLQASCADNNELFLNKYNRKPYIPTCHAPDTQVSTGNVMKASGLTSAPP